MASINGKFDFLFDDSYVVQAEIATQTLSTKNITSVKLPAHTAELPSMEEFCLQGGFAGRAFCQQGDDLDMGGLGEHVERLEKAQGIASFREKPDVPRQSCRVA